LQTAKMQEKLFEFRMHLSRNWNIL